MFMSEKYPTQSASDTLLIGRQSDYISILSQDIHQPDMTQQ